MKATITHNYMVFLEKDGFHARWHGPKMNSSFVGASRVIGCKPEKVTDEQAENYSKEQLKALLSAGYRRISKVECASRNNGPMCGMPDVSIDLPVCVSDAVKFVFSLHGKEVDVLDN